MSNPTLVYFSGSFHFYAGNRIYFAFRDTELRFEKWRGIVLIGSDARRHDNPSVDNTARIFPDGRPRIQASVCRLCSSSKSIPHKEAALAPPVSRQPRSR